MIFKKLQRWALWIVLMGISFACDNDSGEDGGPIEEPVEQNIYYFRGLIDGVPFNVDRDANILDGNQRFMGDASSTTNDYGGLGEPGTGYCYGYYGFSLIYGEHQEDYYHLPGAGIKFARVPVGNCTVENDINALDDLLQQEEFEYSLYPEMVALRTFGFDYFPQGGLGADDPATTVVYSTRFGPNTDASIEITEVIELEAGNYEVKGRFNATLYKFNEVELTKELTDGEFRIILRHNLEDEE